MDTDPTNPQSPPVAEADPDKATMKLRVARTIKWNIIDRLSSQLLYAVTGIVLARMLSQEDFGLVGALLVFQAFASLFVDSGFSSALIQRERPSRLDYSTVLWFNIAMAVGIYAILWLCAPLIALCFSGDQRLIPLSRVMFLTFIVNATAIVPANRLMKQMDVCMIAVSNGLGLIVGAVVGITLAVEGYGPWAIVWQSISLAAVKSIVLWATGHWMPLLHFSWSSLRSFFSVGMGVMGTSLLNTIFQNIYAFLIGNRAGLAPLGYYTQADKWSKMPISSLSQVLTSSFLPVLSRYQSTPKLFAASTAKMSRFTAWVLFPAVTLLAVMATPLFHLLLGTKWDAAIPLFCLLLLRGVFTVMTSLYSLFLLALGQSRRLVVTELLRDGLALAAIVPVLPFIAVSTPADPVEGIRLLLWGQVAASAVACAATLWLGARSARRPMLAYVVDCLPYLLVALVAAAPCVVLASFIAQPLPLLCCQTIVGVGIYLGINRLAGSVIQRDALAYICGRLSRRA